MSVLVNREFVFTINRAFDFRPTIGALYEFGGAENCARPLPTAPHPRRCRGLLCRRPIRGWPGVFTNTDLLTPAGSHRIAHGCAVGSLGQLHLPSVKTTSMSSRASLATRDLPRNGVYYPRLPPTALPWTNISCPRWGRSEHGHGSIPAPGSPSSLPRQGLHNSAPGIAGGGRRGSFQSMVDFSLRSK